MASIFFIFLIFILVILFFDKITGRNFDLSGSGRIEDFTQGFYFFRENIFFGSLLNTSNYNAIVKILPHNFFIFNLFIGGVFYSIITSAFILSMILSIRKSQKNTLLSIYICIMGLQFIPTPFSAYFISILICIAKVEALQINQKLP